MNVDVFLAVTGFAALVVWEVPEPVSGCPHSYQYRLTYVVTGVCRVRYDNERGKGDPKDLYLLGLSQSAHAEFLVTGDKDLLACVRYGATQVVTPRQFWEECRMK